MPNYKLAENSWWNHAYGQIQSLSSILKKLEGETSLPINTRIMCLSVSYNLEHMCNYIEFEFLNADREKIWHDTIQINYLLIQFANMTYVFDDCITLLKNNLNFLNFEIPDEFGKFKLIRKMMVHPSHFSISSSDLNKFFDRTVSPTIHITNFTNPVQSIVSIKKEEMVSLLVKHDKKKSIDDAYICFDWIGWNSDDKRLEAPFRELELNLQIAKDDKVYDYGVHFNEDEYINSFFYTAGSLAHFIFTKINNWLKTKTN